jgi:ABC-type methionine transport system ATPase subunit
MARQAQLEERRQRLLQLQQIDEEQERIRQQLSALHGQQQPVQRAEMP